MIINTSHLKKSYTIEKMSYLDSEEASILYKKQAEIIKQYGLKHIVDVGCRIGEVNKYLDEYDYDYYGFDTSEEPIEYAQKKYPDKLFEVRDWDNLRQMECDVLIFGSVLIYDSNPISMFERIVDFYKPKRSIVHEVDNTNTEDLPYTDLSYFSKHTQYKFKLNIPVGHRTIIDVQH